MILKYKLLILPIVMLSLVQTNAQTKIIAHRGFSSVAPENTLIAFQKAIDSKAHYFELDIHKTKDDTLVVIHDSSVDKTSSNGAKGEIIEMNYSDLAPIRVGYPKKFGNQYKNEKIPTLREALKLAKGKIKVCIELKVLGVEEEVLRIVNDLEMNKEVIIFSFHYPVITKIRTLDKDIPILYLVERGDKTTIDYAKLIKSNAIGVGHGTKITKEYIDFAHKNDTEVWVWTVNEEAQMKQLIELGIDGLITDYPDKALKILNTKK